MSYSFLSPVPQSSATASIFAPYFTVIRTSPLFAGIKEGELSAILDCLSARINSFEKEDFVLLSGNEPTSVGIVLSGNTHVVQEDYWGNRTIISRINPGGMFGEAFACAGSEYLPVSVIAAQKSEILFIDYKKIVTTCTSACSFHQGLIKNMLMVLARKNVFLTQKMGHVSKRNIREKVLSYLSSQAVRASTDVFMIPFNRQELADYLSVDRSALSRELGNMEKEGLLRFQGKRFELLS